MVGIFSWLSCLEQKNLFLHENYKEIIELPHNYW